MTKKNKKNANKATANKTLANQLRSKTLLTTFEQDSSTGRALRQKEFVADLLHMICCVLSAAPALEAEE